MAKKAPAVARILYKEILPGDLRKIHAQSNDSQTGGGARDFRFGNFSQLLPVVKQMFPTPVKQRRKRANQTTTLTIFQGTYHSYDANKVVVEDSFFEPPTTARPSEGRIVRVHQSLCFDVSRIPKGGANNRVLLLLIQNSLGEVWPCFAEENSLKQPGQWDPVVANNLLQCINMKRNKGRAVIGFYDFVTKAHYCA